MASIFVEAPPRNKPNSGPGPASPADDSASGTSFDREAERHFSPLIHAQRSPLHPAHAGFRPRPFLPASWASGPHGQTLVARFLRPAVELAVRRERVTTPDGDFLDLDFAPEPRPGAPIVIVLHGLEGSTRRKYMRVAMRELGRHGLWAVGLNFRSCSGEPNLLPRFYHSGETGDLGFVLGVLGARFPGRRIGALGFSLGGNVLLRLLGERAASATGLLHGAAAISVPFDLAEGSKLLESTRMGRIYARYFLRSLQAKARVKEERLAGILDLERVLAARSLREFDEAATAPLHGFASAEIYYREASSGPHLEKVRVPTLLVHAFDDPFLPASAVPADAIARNPWLLGAIHPRGGHVGFLEGSRPWRPAFWAESEAARYLGEVLAPE
jgi:predicted alpha/beta-fold hydrolase